MDTLPTNLKIILATGGTGGHIFPTQSLAQQLLKGNVQLLFVGGALDLNRYFNHLEYDYRPISAATPFRGNFLNACGKIFKGICQSYKIISQFRPDLIVGFGSFYTFPILLAAYLKKVPFILFEPNIVPGKVNRFFSRKALCSAVQFSATARRLKGRSAVVEFPYTISSSQENSYDYFHLNKNRFTLLVFGGSQGASFINQLFLEAIKEISSSLSFQVIHIIGKGEDVASIEKQYQQVAISASVKNFEKRMDLAWSIADLAICRSGAATIGEQCFFEVPAILIPFPRSMDDHQIKNACFMEQEVGGAITCLEQLITVDFFKSLLEQLIGSERPLRMKEAIALFKKKEPCSSFSSLIFSYFKGRN